MPNRSRFSATRFLISFFVNASECETRRYILENGRIKEQGLLKDHCNPPAIVENTVVFANNFSPEHNLTLKAFMKVAYVLQQSGLTGSVRSIRQKVSPSRTTNSGTSSIVTPPRTTRKLRALRPASVAGGWIFEAPCCVSEPGTLKAEGSLIAVSPFAGHR